MTNPLRRYAVGVLAVGAIAGGAALGLPGSAPGWQPITYGLTESPAQLLPSQVSPAHPVRIVSTALDRDGRPVVTVRTATDRMTAATYVASGQQARRAVGVELDALMSATAVPSGSDPYRAQQWDLAKVRAADAWQKSTGAGVTVAVIDTGVAATNPDLAGQVLPGYDAITKTTGAGTDPNGHGTHVAGTIAALTGNGVGISSTAPNAKILPVRVLGADGSGYMSDAATGITWAADHGANVINMSLGSSSEVSAVTNAITYARSKGVVVVAAAGNNRQSGSPVSYPAADAGVIAVAATDSSDAIANYSNQGSYVDLAAPGTDILSTYPTGSGYATMSGTSMASPHVAALAALLKSEQPALTPDQIEQVMKSTAVDLGTPGRDNDFGYGRIDDASALAAVAPTPSPTATSTPTASPTASPTTSATPGPTKTVTPAPTTASPTPTPSKTTTPAPTPTATPKARPVVTVSTTGQQVAYGVTTTTTFTVTLLDKPWVGQPVQVCVTAVGSGTGCTNAVTGPTGGVAVQRTATGNFQLSLTVPGTAGTDPVTSPTATWTVQSAVVATRVGSTMTVVITGAVGQAATIQRQDGNNWVTAATFSASPRVTVTGLVSGQHYRVVVSDTAAILGATSSVV